jgi:hypothetical protein
VIAPRRPYTPHDSTRFVVGLCRAAFSAVPSPARSIGRLYSSKNTIAISTTYNASNVALDKFEKAGEVPANARLFSAVPEMSAIEKTCAAEPGSTAAADASARRLLI